METFFFNPFASLYTHIGVQMLNKNIQRYLRYDPSYVLERLAKKYLNKIKFTNNYIKMHLINHMTIEI